MVEDCSSWRDDAKHSQLSRSDRDVIFVSRGRTLKLAVWGLVDQRRQR